MAGPTTFVSVRDRSGSDRRIPESLDTAWHGAWRSGSDRVHAHAIELFRILSPFPDGPQVARICKLDSSGVRRNHTGNRASQGFATGAHERLTRSFSAHRRERVIAKQIPFPNGTNDQLTRFWGTNEQHHRTKRKRDRRGTLPIAKRARCTRALAIRAYDSVADAQNQPHHCKR